MNNSKLVIAAALALTGALGVGMAQAHGRDDVQWSVTIGAPIYGQAAPVYTPAYPVYTQPYPVYRQPAPVYQHHGYRQPTRWDVDGDGIPNRFDRVYNPRWDRDGDGIPDRYERAHYRSYDRDGDGIPNRYDRHDDRDGWRR